MKVLIKYPGIKSLECEIPNDLEKLQIAVGGYIEVVPIEDNILAIVDEEGLLKGKDFAVCINGIRLYGTVIFVSQNGEEFDSLTEEQIRRIWRLERGSYKIR